MTPPVAPTRRRWLAAVRVLYLVGLGALVVWLAWQRRDDLARLVSDPRPGWLVAAFALSLGQLLPSVALWTIGIRELAGSPVPLRAVAAATVRSLPARYLPGSIWYAVGRAALLRTRHGVATGVVGTVAALETVLVLLGAIGLGTVALAAAGRTPDRPLLLASWFAVLAVAASPPVVSRLLAVLARRRNAVAPRLSWRTWSRLAGVVVVHWVWSSVTFATYLAAFPRLDPGSIVEVAGSFLVAWAIGFLAVFAPQGAGVFETAVGALLVGGAATATAALIAGGYRALVLVRDGLLFLAGTLVRRRRPRTGDPPTSSP